MTSLTPNETRHAYALRLGTVPTIALLERLASALDAELTVSVHPRTAA